MVPSKFAQYADLADLKVNLQWTTVKAKKT